MLRVICLATIACICGCSQRAERQPSPESQVDVPDVMSIRSASFDSDGVSIRFYERGPRAGEPVVSLHGLFGNGSQIIDHPVSVSLAKSGCRVIAPDFRGHGESEKPREGREYGDKMVQDITNLLDHLEIQRAQVIGYSMGGMILTKLAVDHRDRVSSLVIGGCGGIRENFMFEFVDAFTEAVENGAQAGDALIASWDTLQSGPLDDELRIAFGKLNQQDAVALAAVVSSWRDLIVSEEQLMSVSKPTLVIYGSREGENTLLLAKEMARLIPGSEAIEIDGATHSTAHDSEIYMREVVRFISQHKVK